MERTSGWRMDQAGRLARDRSEPLLVLGDARQALHEPHGVGVPRRSEDRVDVAELDDAPRVHHDDPIRQLGNDAEVVRDEDGRRVGLALRGLEDVQDLRLNGDVEGSRRLVRDQERRDVGDRHRDHGSLPHAAGELVRVLVDAPLGARDADEPQQLDHALLGRARTHMGLVLADRLLDLMTDGEHWVERGHRVLEDHGDLATADLAQLTVLEREQIAALEERLAADDTALRDQAEQRHHAHALP